MCRQLGLEPEFVELDWSGRGGGPESGRSGLPLERHHSPFGSFRDPGFTQTYLASRPALVIRWDEVEQYQTAEQLKGKTVAVEAGSAGRALRWHACRTCQWLLWAARRQLWRKSKGLAQGAVVDHLVAQAAVEAHRELTVQPRVELGTEELAVALPTTAT